ncbi:Major facilitator superfamily domain general substrate transporter [Penicillium atrosanguineum]|uniref:Major facilitator superfamily domain general substrate transporter n=1 Tax=Penicillium atrosanguineum TaxID=1132637 RepID=A0A9W9U386_9EURO|nr:Major facilitator superfamily domain general substrate transporter [Penicillium atrosanguineum]KAJ5314882.1 Major facilitator superfamily domain general substrate transporter [Penicillium atrosanguineum]
MSCVESLAIIAAPLVGGALTQAFGCKWCFWDNLPIRGVSLATLFFLFSDPTTCQENHLTFTQKISELDLGIGTTAFDYYAPFMIFASVCMPIATGLMTTYDLNTSLAKIILYSGFVGFSEGIDFQPPQAAVQTALSTAEVNLGIGVILFGQSMGPAVFIAIAEVILTNQLLSSLKDAVPGLKPAYILIISLCVQIWESQKIFLFVRFEIHS